MIARLGPQLVAVVALPLVFLGVVDQVGAALAGRRGPRLLRPARDLRRALRRGGRVGLVGLMAATLACLLAPLTGPRAPLGFPGDLAALVGLFALVRRDVAAPGLHVPLALAALALVVVGARHSVASLAADPLAALATAAALLLALRVTAAGFAADVAPVSLEDTADADAADRPLTRHTAGVAATALAGLLAALAQPTPLAPAWLATALHLTLLVAVAALVGLAEARLAPLRPRAAPLHLGAAALLAALAVLLSTRGAP